MVSAQNNPAAAVAHQHPEHDQDHQHDQVA